MIDWAVVTLPRLQLEEEAHLGHYLLLRRSLKDPSDITYYVVFAPQAEASLEQLVQVARQRWIADHQLEAGIRLEQGFQLAKGECGLDHYGPED
jgi:SRSO17 transposase